MGSTAADLRWQRSSAATAPDISVAISPQQSVYLLLRDGAHGSRPAVPHGVVRSVRRSLAHGEHAFALRPIHRRAPGAIPSALVPIPPRGDVSVAEQVAQLRDTDGDEFAGDVAGLGASEPAWRPAADQATRWLHAYADASAAAWRGIEPWWRSARPLIDREVERIGVASVRGGHEALLNTLSPRLAFADDTLYLDGEGNCPVPLNGRRLVLVPVVTSRAGVFVHISEPDLVGVAYPVRGLGTVGEQSQQPGRLEVVLGVARSTVLRRLDVPLTMGAVARILVVTPAAATRHCDVLVRAGLITRERRGKEVYVARTDRGGELLDLLG